MAVGPSSAPRGWVIWTWPGWSGEFELEVSSLCCRIQLLYNVIMEVLKVINSVLQANGSEEIVQKVQVLKFGQCVESHHRWFCLLQKKAGCSIWTQFLPDEVGIWINQSSKVQMPGGCVGKWWSFFIDQLIILQLFFFMSFYICFRPVFSKCYFL